MPLRAPRYMTRFRCVGSECRDNCCHHWRIRIDRDHHDALKARMSSPEEQAEFATAVRLTGDRNPQLHAMLVLDDAGDCSFLAKDGACSVHARYGEEMLPDACSRFPRTIGRIIRDHELYGSTSCPEVVVQMLASDDAMDLVPAAPELFGRGLVSQALEPDERSPYKQSLRDVRDVALWLLGQSRFPVAGRLFFIAAFAHNARSFLHRDMSSADTRELHELSHSLEAPGALDHLYGQYTGLSVGPRFGISVVRELLCLPDRFLPASLLALRGETGVRLAAHGARLTDDDLGALEHAYLDLPPLPAELETRLSTAVERFAANQLLVEWFTAWPSFLGWVIGLLTRVAAIRFLVRTNTTTTDRAAFDDLIVRVIYSFSRLLEHEASLAGRVFENLEQQGSFGIQCALSLTRV